jgi:hypothetical protein
VLRRWLSFSLCACERRSCLLVRLHTLTHTYSLSLSHIYTYVRTHMYTCEHTRVHTHSYTYICVHTQIYTHSHIYAYVRDSAILIATGSISQYTVRPASSNLPELTFSKVNAGVILQYRADDDLLNDLRCSGKLLLSPSVGSSATASSLTTRDGIAALAAFPAPPPLVPPQQLNTRSYVLLPLSESAERPSHVTILDSSLTGEPVARMWAFQWTHTWGDVLLELHADEERVCLLFRSVYSMQAERIIELPSGFTSMFVWSVCVFDCWFCLCVCLFVCSVF